jgi:hypothetical protein
VPYQRRVCVPDLVRSTGPKINAVQRSDFIDYRDATRTSGFVDFPTARTRDEAAAERVQGIHRQLSRSSGRRVIGRLL